MKILLLLFALCLPASAQHMLWTWDAAALPNGSASGLQLIASDEKGTTCLLIGEIEPADREGSYNPYCRLVLVSARGKELVNQRIGFNGGSIRAVLGQEPADDPWKVLDISARGALIAGQGRMIRVKVHQGNVTVTETPHEDGVEVLPLAAVAPLRGFVKKKADYRFHLPDPSNYIMCYELRSLSLWSIR